MKNAMKNVVLVMMLSAALAASGVNGSVLAQAKKRDAAKAEKAEKAIDPDAPVMAQGGVFKCTDRDGNVTYGNTGDVKGCKKIETDTVNTAPFPKAAAGAPAAAFGNGAVLTVSVSIFLQPLTSPVLP